MRVLNRARSSLVKQFLPIAIGAIGISFSISAHADQFHLPLDCDYGKDCFIQKYVDVSKGKAYRDYKCGILTNDGHRGTDFRLLDYDQLDRGVDVLAAADGKVIEARDYMPDVNVALIGKEAVMDRGLGNQVTIQHDNGFITAYAHLRRNSVLVKKGDLVKAGQPIGLVGLSGLTEFPHLHFEVVKKKIRYDPFTGLPTTLQTAKCGIIGKSMWKDDLPYTKTHLIRIGMFSTRLTRHAMEHKLYENPRLRPTAKGVLLNAYVAGIFKGDVFNVKIWHNNQNKPFYDQTGKYDQDEAYAVITGGRSDIKKPWPKGIYKGQLTYSRPDKAGKLTTVFQEVARVEIK